MPTPVVRTERVTVRVPSYVALPSNLTTVYQPPMFPVELTNATWLQYTLDLQTALKINVDKLTKIRSLQPKGH